MRHFLKLFVLLTLLAQAPAQAALIYMNPSNSYPTGEHANDWLEKRTAEIRTQKWIRLKLDVNTFAWTSEDTLLTRDKLIGRAFIKTQSSLNAQPRHKSDHLTTLEVAEYVTLLGEEGEFLKVRTGFGNMGFVLRKNAITGSDLKPKDAMFTQTGIILRSAPTPDSVEIRRSQFLQQASIAEVANLKWGRVEVPGRGSVWWPLDETAKVATQPSWPKFSSAEIFLKRKIFDVVASPSVPNLRFVSARGIFRTINDRDWEKIPYFGDKDYPVAISKSGRIFVGSFYSDDHGETFHSFVRFDQLVSSLRNRWKIATHKVKFLAVKPMNSSGSELMLKLDIGLRSPVQAITRDHGTTWQAL